MEWIIIISNDDDADDDRCKMFVLILLFFLVFHFGHNLKKSSDAECFFGPFADNSLLFRHSHCFMFQVLFIDFVFINAFFITKEER